MPATPAAASLPRIRPLQESPRSSDSDSCAVARDACSSCDRGRIRCLQNLATSRARHRAPRDVSTQGSRPGTLGATAPTPPARRGTKHRTRHGTAQARHQAPHQARAPGTWHPAPGTISQCYIDPGLMSQEARSLSAEQFLLTTLVVKLAVAAALATCWCVSAGSAASCSPRNETGPSGSSSPPDSGCPSSSASPAGCCCTTTPRTCRSPARSWPA